MSTIIMSKADLLEVINDQIKDDAIIAFTTDLNGSLKVSTRGNVKTVPIGFCADVFKQQDTVSDLIPIPIFGIAVMKPEEASDRAHKLYNHRDDEADTQQPAG